jgi:hypothetical protein
MKTIVDFANKDSLDPELILPVQFHYLWCGARKASPERMLMLSMLWQAANDLAKNRGAQRPKRRRLYREAYRWVASNDRTWPYSFVNLCEALSLSPEALRAALLAEVTVKAA